MTMTTIDLDTVERISSPAEVERLALAAYDLLIADLEHLDPEDWQTVTVCRPWTVADMARHVLGAAKGTARTREMLRQQIYGARNKQRFNGNALDATNSLQVADHQELSPRELVAELKTVAPAAVKGRMRKAAVLSRINVPIDVGGSTAAGMPQRLNLGDLMRVVYTRDTWLHRIDIARSLGAEPSLDAATDRRMVEDVAKEWAERHGQPFDLALSGSAGGRYRRGSHGPVIQLDAIEFCWILSGRAAYPVSRPGADLLAQRVLF